MKIKNSMKKLGRNLFIYTLTLSMLLPNFNLSVMSYADDDTTDETSPLLEIESSVGSVNMEDDGTTIGVDKNQGQKTEYTDEIQEEGSSEAKVYVTQASSFAVVIPKVIILDGQAKNADYRIGVKGDLAGKGYVDVLAQPSFWMYDIVGVKSPQKATVTQNNHMFVSSNLNTVPADAINNVNSDTYVYTNGSINCAGITAGSWKGEFNFVIGAFRDFENPVVMATDGTVLEVTQANLYLGENYKGTKNAQVTVNGALANAPAEPEEPEEPTEPVVENGGEGNESAFANFVDLLILTQDVYADDELLARTKTAQSLEWTSSSDKVLVDQNGNVSLADGALAGDVATITATYKGVESSEPGVIDREDISVSFNVNVFDIVMSQTQLELATGQQGAITANVTPASLANVLEIEWTEPLMMEGVGFNVENNKVTMNIDVATTAVDDNNGILVASTEDYEKNCRLVVLPNHKHTYQVTASGVATCFDMGYTTYTCSSCDASVEGHTYTDNTPKLEHSLGDGHFCDLCDTLVVPYKKGDSIRRTVKGNAIKFYCADPEYVDNAGKKGAYFISRDVFPQIYGSNGTIWANSTARSAINGTNSDTSRLMLTDTTVTEYGDGALTSNNWTMSAFDIWPIAEHKQVKTEDYFFYPSLRETVTYNEMYLFPTGYHDELGIPIGSDTNYYEHYISLYGNSTKYPAGLVVFNLRTSAGKTAAEYNKNSFFFYSDGSTITSWLCGTGWQTGTNGNWLYARPACVIEQDLNNYENGYLKKEDWVKGDVVERIVAGETMKFVCIAPNYFDINGNNVGALFLATDIIGASKTNFDNKSNEWATSDLRAYLNGPNSDTSGLVKVNTTVTEKMTKECRSWWGMNVPDYDFVNIDNPTTTEDYYFVLSARELQNNQGFMLSSTGEIRDMHLKWDVDKYGYYTRTPFGDSSNVAAYVLSDAKYYNTLGTYKVNNDIIGVRPACVLPN